MIARATNFSQQVALINAASGGADTCVFVPPPQMGLGCKCAPLSRSHRLVQGLQVDALCVELR